MQPAAKALPLLSILDGLNNHHGKKYCYPSQLKIMALLADRLDISISIASLNRYLRVIEDNGFIERTRRIRRDRVKGMIFQSTLYKICGKGLKLLAKFGLSIYSKIRKLNGPPGEKPKKGAADPERLFHVPGGISYAKYLANGGKSPSIKK